jgi:hypothetical protein
LKEVFVKLDGEYYLAVIKTTTAKARIYLLSYRRSNREDITREMKAKGAVTLKNNL